LASSEKEIKHKKSVTKVDAFYKLVAHQAAYWNDIMTTNLPSAQHEASRGQKHYISNVIV